MSSFDVFRRIMSSPAFKFLLVATLILVLTIPMLFVMFLTWERAQYARGAQAEIGQKWGRAQTLRGPFIIVPAIKLKEVSHKDGTRIEKIRHLTFLLPEKLNIESNAKSQILKRGIYEVPVYRSTNRISGIFKTADLSRVNRSVDEILWDEAVLAIVINDVRSIKQTAELHFSNGKSELFKAGIGLHGQNVKGIHVPLTSEEARNGFQFRFDLALNGSSKIGFVPAGGETSVKIEADWPHPSFDGAFLPEERNINENGFSANWSIPRLARGQGQVFILQNLHGLMRDVEFNVRFYRPVGFYDLVGRALKYALGFIAIAFLAVFILEMNSEQTIHWIQYLFVGLAMIIFYLVLLGTSEHIGFEYAYFGSAMATCILIGLYTLSAFGSVTKGALLFFVLSLVYGLLYLLLRVEDYALLIGSLAAFTLLSVIMFMTRNVDWAESRNNLANTPEGA